MTSKAITHDQTTWKDDKLKINIKRRRIAEQNERKQQQNVKIVLENKIESYEQM